MAFRGQGMHKVISLLHLFQSAVNKTLVQKWKERDNMQNDEMKCNCQVHRRMCVCLGKGELGLDRVPLCLLMRQSLLKDANKFSSWLTAHRVIRCETFRRTCFSLCVFFSLSVSQILPSLTISGEQSSLCWPSTWSENRSNHLFIDWNIRGLRGSEGVEQQRAGKIDRLGDNGGEKKGGCGGKWNGVENKEGEKIVERLKSGPFCLNKKTSQHVR